MTQLLTQYIQSWLENAPADARSNIDWRVLAVTDSAELQAALSEALTKTASRVLRIVEQIDEAVQLGIDGEFWDLVLIVCPNSNDLDSIHRARHEVGLSRAAILALVSRTEDLRSAINAGADDALTLPLDVNTIALHIDQALEHRSLRNAVDQYWISTAQEHELDLARFMVDAAPDALLVLDADGTVQAANPTAAKLFCCETGMLVGSPIGAFLDGLSTGAGQTARIQRLLDHFSADAGPIETILHRLDGKTLPVEAYGRIVSRLGQSTFSVAIRDISKRSKIAPQAPVIDREIDRQATILRQLAQMSSELLGPLQDIASRADVIRQEALGPIGVPLYQNYAADIQQSSRAILKLVERLLSMTNLNLPRE
jgi:PAS domain S-box-containing protein